MLKDKNDSMIISYINLRRLVGTFGILLPFICIIGGAIFTDIPVQRSISYYYHTNMRDFFVGLLFGVSMFLITYRGYEKIDNIIATASAIASLGIPTFPCLLNNNLHQLVGIFQIESHMSNKIHLTCSSIFFFLLAINSIFLFTLSDKDKSLFSRNKKIRNIIYVSCGVVILLSLASIAIFLLVLNQETIIQSKIILIFETIMLFAFSISWLIKGETLFKD
ncbi:hypothetical protein HZA55_06500 [Candidatus Poribacteria bacterium]|nr:hypothetical protein [Candidatus Poribacteria bacterium]